MDGPSSNSRAAELERGIVLQAEARRCGDRWKVFCQLVIDNVQYALSRGFRVIVAGQPYHNAEKSGMAGMKDLHREQQDTLAEMLEGVYGGNRAVRFADFRTTIDLMDPNLSFDYFHLNARGNEILAGSLADTVSEVLSEMDGARRTGSGVP